MSVLYPLIQALVLFAVAPLLSGITRVARARLHNRRGPGVLQEYRDIFKLLGRPVSYTHLTLPTTSRV